VSEFISFITSEAAEKCATEKRKTLNGDDILFAINALGFSNYNQNLNLYIKKYREAIKDTENTSTKNEKDKESWQYSDNEHIVSHSTCSI